MNKFKRIIGFVLLTAILFSAVSCGGNGGEPSETDAPEEPPKYVLTLSNLGDNVEIHTDLQVKYLNDTYDSIGKYIPDIETERSLPKEVELTWTIYDNVNQRDYVPYITYNVKVATKADFSDAKVYRTADEYYKLSNLYIGQTYYWKVSFEDEDDNIVESAVATFTTTDQGPRNLKIDGVTNSRDLGGWTTKDGKKVKQGMLYRTAKISKTEKEYITAAGKKTMLEELGIKSELDLRSGSSEIREESVLGGVKLFNYGFSGSDMEKVEEQLPNIFEALADEDNYPIFFHCAIGTDRTGVVAYLVLALLGVSEEDIYRDYCFSNFGNIKSGDDNAVRIPKERLEAEGKVASVVKASAGSTLQEKTRNYLKSLGISDATLDSVVRLMLEN